MAMKYPDPKGTREQCLLCGRAGVLKCVCSYRYCCESCKISDWAHHVKVCHKMPNFLDQVDADDDSDSSTSTSNSSSSSSGGSGRRRRKLVKLGPDRDWIITRYFLELTKLEDDQPSTSGSAKFLAASMRLAAIRRNPYPKEGIKLRLYPYCCDVCDMSDWDHHVKTCQAKLSDEFADFGSYSSGCSSSSSSNKETSSSFSIISSSSSNSSSSDWSSTGSIFNRWISDNSSSINVQIKPNIDLKKYIKICQDDLRAEALESSSFFKSAYVAAPEIPKSQDKIIISVFVALNTFYIRSIGQSIAYHALQDALQKYLCKSHVLCTLPKVGDIVMTKRNSRGYARVFITDVRSKFNIKCFYIDYGDTVVRTLRDLRSLTLELQRAQRFILQNRLKNVPNIPMTEVNENVLKLLTSLVGDFGFVDFDGDYAIGKEVDVHMARRHGLLNEEIMKLYENAS